VVKSSDDESELGAQEAALIDGVFSVLAQEAEGNGRDYYESAWRRMSRVESTREWRASA